MAISTGMKRRGTMMLRPVEFDATGDPRPGQADQRGLDDVLPIEKIVTVGLVLTDMNAAADFRQDHDAEEFVFRCNMLSRRLLRGFGLRCDR